MLLRFIFGDIITQTVMGYEPFQPELRGNWVDFPFHDTIEFEALPFRDSPYWHWLLTCRHLGIHRPDSAYAISMR